MSEQKMPFAVVQSILNSKKQQAYNNMCLLLFAFVGIDPCLLTYSSVSSIAPASG